MRRLESIPPDLEHLYDHMLSAIDPVYKEEGSKIFQLIRKGRTDMEAIYWALSADLQSTLVKPLPTPDLYRPAPRHDGFENILEEMEIILQTRCRGLLEVLILREDGRKNQEMNLKFKWKQGFLFYIHASVADYLYRPEIWGDIIRHTRYKSRLWNPEMAQIMSSVLCLKSLKCFEIQESRQTLKYIRWCWALMQHTVREIITSKSSGFNHDTLADLLDAFDAAATNLVQSFRTTRGSNLGPTNHHWAHRNKSAMWQVDIL